MTIPHLISTVSVCFQCLASLAQWDDLELVSVAAVDDNTSPDLSKVWEDTFLQVKE